MSSWSYWICDTRTGVKQLQVFPSGGPFGRTLNAAGQGGSNTFQLGDRKLSREQWKDLTTPWRRELVRCWDDHPVYSGVITGRPYNRDTQTLTVNHADVRALLAKRYPFGVNSYYADGVAAPPGKLVLTNLSLRAIAANVVQQGMVGPHPIYSLPIVLPSLTEAGPYSRTYFNYNFTTVPSALQELQDVDGGPDIDFAPRWSSSDTLEWVMRTGTPTAPALTGGTFEFNLTSKNCPLTHVGVDEDGSKQVNGMFTIGKGSEEDMRVSGRGIGDYGETVFPALDGTQPLKDIDDLGVLLGHSIAAINVQQDPTKQWEMSLLASGYPGLNALTLGSTLRVYSKGDPWIDDGWTSLRLIGFSGDATETIALDVQPIGGV